MTCNAFTQTHEVRHDRQTISYDGTSSWLRPASGRATPEDMNNYIYFNSLGNGLHLAEHLGNPDTTIITSEVYISREPTTRRRGLMVPDLLIAFNVDSEAHQAGNGYIISDQASPRTSCWK